MDTDGHRFWGGEGGGELVWGDMFKTQRREERRGRSSYQHGAGGDAVAGGVLTKGLGPGAIAVAIVGIADEGKFAGGSEFFFEAAKIGAEFFVGGNAEAAIFEIVTESESEFFLFWAREGD